MKTINIVKDIDYDIPEGRLLIAAIQTINTQNPTLSQEQIIMMLNDAAKVQFEW